MPLTVVGTPDQRKMVEAILQKICPSAMVQQGTPSSGNVTVGSGPFPSDNVGCCCLFNLILYGNTTFIRLIEKPTQIVPRTNRTIAKFGGAATRPWSTGKKRRGPGDKLVNGPGGGSTVYLDISDNNDDGYFVLSQVISEDGRIVKQIDNPLHVILFHELCTGHATESMRGEFVVNDERGALACENRFRAQLGLSLRLSGQGRPNPPGTGKDGRPGK